MPPSQRSVQDGVHTASHSMPAGHNIMKHAEVISQKTAQSVYVLFRRTQQTLTQFCQLSILAMAMQRKSVDTAEKSTLFKFVT